MLGFHLLELFMIQTILKGEKIRQIDGVFTIISFIVIAYFPTVAANVFRQQKWIGSPKIMDNVSA